MSLLLLLCASVQPIVTSLLPLLPLMMMSRLLCMCSTWGCWVIGWRCWQQRLAIMIVLQVSAASAQLAKASAWCLMLGAASGRICCAAAAAVWEHLPRSSSS